MIYIQDTVNTITKLNKDLIEIIEKMKFKEHCPVCNEVVFSEYKYCPYCGHKIEIDDTSWKKVDQELPPEDVIVQTKIGDVDGQLLCMHKGHWIIPETEMYIYYTPTHWRYSEEK